MSRAYQFRINISWCIALGFAFYLFLIVICFSISIYLYLSYSGLIWGRVATEENAKRIVKISGESCYNICEIMGTAKGFNFSVKGPALISETGSWLIFIRGLQVSWGWWLTITMYAEGLHKKEGAHISYRIHETLYIVCTLPSSNWQSFSIFQTHA